jgi:hypothetical protein
VAHEVTDFDLAVYRQSCLRIGFGRPTKAWQTAASLRLRGYLHKGPSQRKGDIYSKLKQDVAFRKEVAERIGVGFELPLAVNT